MGTHPGLQPQAELSGGLHEWRSMFWGQGPMARLGSVPHGDHEVWPRRPLTPLLIELFHPQLPGGLGILFLFCSTEPLP